MKLAIIISQNDPETIFQAFRLGNFSLKQKDEVGVFLVGKGVEMDKIQDQNFNVQDQAQSFLDAGGKIMACGTCLSLRNSSGSSLCPLSSLKDLYELIKEADKIITY